MASAITKSTLVSDTWENFFDILKTDVLGTRVTDSHSVTHTLSRATSSFPDTAIDKKSTYPIMVVNSPRFTGDTQFTLDKEASPGQITIDIYTTGSEAADKFLNKIIDSIETSRGSLADNKIKDVKKIDTDADSESRSRIKIHVRSVTYGFTYRYTRTRAH